VKKINNENGAIKPFTKTNKTPTYFMPGTSQDLGRSTIDIYMHTYTKKIIIIIIPGWYLYRYHLSQSHLREFCRQNIHPLSFLQLLSHKTDTQLTVPGRAEG